MLPIFERPPAGVDYPFSRNPFLDLCAWRDRNGLIGRVASQAALAVLTPITLIETVVRCPLAIIGELKGSQKWANGFGHSGITAITSLYALCTNLFVQKITSHLVETSLNLWLNPHEIFKNGYTFAMAPQRYGRTHMEGLIPLNDYEKDYLQLKPLSHWLGLKGDIELHGHTLPLEHAPPHWLLGSLNSAFQKFVKSDDFQHLRLGKEKAEELTEALNSAYTDYNKDKLVERVHNRILSFVDAGWENHRIGLCFYGDYLAIGNRGEGSFTWYSTLEVFKIEPSLFTEEMLKEIDKLELSPMEEGVKFFYEILPAKLSATGKKEKDDLCKSFSSIAPGFSKGGHCALAGNKAALRFAWAMLLSNNPDKSTLQQGHLESRIFANWTAVDLLEQVTADKFTGLKDRQAFCDQAAAKGNYKWNKLQYYRWRAGIYQASALDLPIFVLTAVNDLFWSVIKKSLTNFKSFVLTELSGLAINLTGAYFASTSFLAYSLLTALGYLIIALPLIAATLPVTRKWPSLLRNSKFTD